MTSGTKNDAGVRPRILVVDDDRMILVAVRRVLREHEVIGVEDAAQALDMVEGGERFDLILCDLTMPGMGGIEFYETLLTRRPTLVSQLVFLTGGAATSRGRAFLESIPNEQVSKPFEPAELRALVQRRLDAITRAES